MWPILDDILEVGFDGFHPIQPQCMKIEDVKAHAAGRICLLGNIDCRDLLPFGTVGEVERSVRETIEKAAPGAATSSALRTRFTRPVRRRTTSPWSGGPQIRQVLTGSRALSQEGRMKDAPV